MTSSMVAQTNDHVALFATALHWLAQGHTVALATVLKTWGSAPRPSGSHMIVRGDGLFEGSVSGGCVEGAVIADALFA
jgi:xanthine dehydrogenase accessory factor